MREILVVANRTLGGEKLLEAARARAAAGDASFRLVVPQSTPSAGFVVYDEAVRESAQVRVDLAISLMADEGIELRGEVGDPDPFLATMDAVAAIFKAVNRYGNDAGRRTLRYVAQRPAAYERISSRARGSGARRPRIMAIVTGKNVR